MRAEERAQQCESSISIMELICSPTLRAPLVIGIVMQLSQQLSGINAVSSIFSLSFHLSVIKSYILICYLMICIYRYSTTPRHYL